MKPPLLGPLLHRLARALFGLARNRRATAAVEFVFVLPVALILYVGAAEVSDGVMTSRKVSNLTRTLVDLLSKQMTSPQSTSAAATSPVDASVLATMLTSSATLIYPKPAASLTMTISAVDVANTSAGVCCTATVRWSYTQGGTLRPCGVGLTPGPNGATNQVTTFPTDLMPTGTVLPATLHYLVADVSYVYQPAAGTSILSFTPTMARSEYMMPRTVGQVSTGALPAAGTQYGKVCY